MYVRACVYDSIHEEKEGERESETRTERMKYFVCLSVSGTGVVDLTKKYSISPVFRVCMSARGDKINYFENCAVKKRQRVNEREKERILIAQLQIRQFYFREF